MRPNIPENTLGQTLKHKTLLAIFTAAATLAPVAEARSRHHARRAAGATSSDFTTEGLPNVQSTSAYVVDLDDGAVLYEKDSDVVRPLASLSKMMSALVITESCKIDWDELHEMSPANRDAAKGGDKTKLNTGWQFTHRDLLYAALMRSDNRALPALGEACGLTPAQLGEKMTEKARALGLKNTFFREPTGLSQENVSTAREILVILKTAIKVPEIATIMGTKEYEITGHKGHLTRKIKIKNTDRMLGKEDFEILGGKTGYTDPARYCLAIAARLPEKKSVAMVFLGAEGRFTRFADFTRVMKWVAKGREQNQNSELQIADSAKIHTRTVPAKATGLGFGGATVADKAKAAAKAAAAVIIPEAKADSPSGSASNPGEPAQSLKW